MTLGPRVLVLSNMYPRAGEPLNGSFVRDQVDALRRHAAVDARVVTGVPYPLPVRKPWQVVPTLRRGAADRKRTGWQVVDGIPTAFVPYFTGKVREWLPGHAYAQSMSAVVDRLRSDFAFQLVHSHTSHLDGYAGRRIARRHRVPHVITEHTGPFSTITDRRRFRRPAVVALNDADRIICVSPALADDMRPWISATAADRVTVIPNAVDVERFAAPEKRIPDPKRPRIAFVGHLVDVKNTPLLVEAFIDLHRQVPGAVLNIAGDGPYRPQLVAAVRRAHLESQVRFFGSLTRDQLPDFYRREADLLVLCSKAETFGIVLIEALSAGLPCVASRCGGPESIITDGSLGELCPRNDRLALTQALLRVIERLPTYDSARIREHAVGHYSATSVARRLGDLYRTMCPTARATTNELET